MRAAQKWTAGVLALSLGVVAGCSGGSSPAEAPKAGGESASKQVAAPSTTPAAGGKQVKIEYFQMKSEMVDTVNGLIKDFQSKNPNITVEQNNVPNPENIWMMRVSTDDAPPIFTHYPHNPVFQQMAKDGRVVDMTGTPFMANVQPAIADVSKINGKNYAVPIAVATLGVHYNVDIFNKLGLKIPQTYDELIQTAEKIKAAGITPIYFYDKDWNAIRQEVVSKMGLMLPDVENFLDSVMKGKAHITDNPNFKPFAQKLYDLRKYAQKDNLGTGYDDALREFANGKAAMLYTGIWAVKTIKQSNPNLNFAMFPLPAEKAENTKAQVSVDTAIGLPAKGKNQDEAKKFLEYMSSKEVVQKYVDAGGYPAAIQGVTNNTKEINSLNDLIVAGKVFPTIERVWPTGVNGDVGKATQEMLATGDIDGYLKKLDTIFYNKLNQ
ncbi:extracellular solute-binding protein [Paenibacillus thalictri]|uniref:Extracellular solute-binding protein n=1 Tax=Paenibacillus thalictri TaxID=2527873 RepID=A0A4V2J4A1_9BACL|nr:extracellular solute-binding protein [Paenibacillus thalictri]TBL78651.1 extracellular solute-binding protein [Paenibacillus thalictri]